MQMEVIGEDGSVYDVEVEGDDVMGDVMGYSGPMGGYEGGAAVVGYDDYGMPIVQGAKPKPKKRLRLRRPGWRASQIAPGVIAPDQGMEPLPMGTFTYTATALTNTFSGQIQKPFRGERWLLSVVRTGTSATGRILAQIFVGTDLAQLDVAPIDLEQLGDPNAFGVRLTMKPAQPGVFIRAVSSLSGALTGTDTIFVSLTLLGRNIH